MIIEDWTDEDDKTEREIEKEETVEIEENEK